MLLKDYYHHDAIALGLATTNGLDTRQMLCEWAELIVLTTDEVNHGHIAPEFAAKTVLWDVGPDRFKHDMDPELLALDIAFIDAYPAIGPPVGKYAADVDNMRKGGPKP